jgi:hypothetical protein
MNQNKNKQKKWLVGSLATLAVVSIVGASIAADQGQLQGRFTASQFAGEAERTPSENTYSAPEIDGYTCVGRSANPELSVSPYHGVVPYFADADAPSNGSGSYRQPYNNLTDLLDKLDDAGGVGCLNGDFSDEDTIYVNNDGGDVLLHPYYYKTTGLDNSGDASDAILPAIVLVGNSTNPRQNSIAFDSLTVESIDFDYESFEGLWVRGSIVGTLDSSDLVSETQGTTGVDDSESPNLSIHDSQFENLSLDYDYLNNVSIYTSTVQNEMTFIN